jgi:hypothetical protein
MGKIEGRTRMTVFKRMGRKSLPSKRRQGSARNHEPQGKDAMQKRASQAGVGIGIGRQKEYAGSFIKPTGY